MYSRLEKTHDFILGPCDTDSISMSKHDGSSFTKEEQDELLNEINNLMPGFIKYAHDGYFEKVLVLKSKNYILFDGKKIKIRGSALKSSKLEPKLKDLQKEVINCFLEDRQQDISQVYEKYIKEVYTLTDIKPWCSKKTYTEKVVNSDRTNESKIRDAVADIDIQMGDKVYVYFTVDDKLKRPDQWTGDHDKQHLSERVWKTLNIFENVLNIKDYPKYHLKKAQRDLLPKLLEKCI